jgi:hypothetical protein
MHRTSSEKPREAGDFERLVIKMNAKRYPFLTLLLLAPTVALADGVSPVLNFFHKETWLPASVVTLVIILLESGLLRWRIKSLRFAGTLWRSAVLNVASSVTGSVLLVMFSRDSFFMWDTMSLVAPLFLITLMTEIPLLRVLFKTVHLSWKRAVFLGCGINISSYAAVFIIETGVLFGWLFYAGHLDKKELEQWNNPDLSGQASGLIYATESAGSRKRPFSTIHFALALFAAADTLQRNEPSWGRARR